MGADEKLAALCIVLPPLKLPPGMVLPFPWVNVRGDRAYVSGHGPQGPDGSLAGPFGAVGESVSLDEARASARKVGLSMLSSLKRELGSLDRITGWCRVHGMVNSAPGFTQTPAVMNGFSDLILEIFGPEIGRHARTAIGVAALPFDLPVEIEAEVMIKERMA
ncbi:RidA family protein [Mesorhizobium sp.]|uniref:RidA family protein n=1 Tax=Mesorhizobium sp. TaxID=1871066 RepID=UPI000FE7B048|nr:RidA family protein [Mesorhizobium sp.]RWA72193.1 MAG: RidA family protein [Mesorhizobium sp.]RWA76116.1 MAG: RidA family protein [Mesorhizobium sp.]